MVNNKQIIRQPRFGSSGIRLPFGNQLVSTALNLGLICGSKYKNIIVGCDTRTSSDILKNILASGLRAGGATILDAGVLPTPTLAFAAKKADLAIMITASHNPPNYNGFKLIIPSGAGIDFDTQREIEAAIWENNFRTVKWTDVGSIEVYRTAIDEHYRAIERNCKLDRKVKVVVDCCCGAAYSITPLVLRGMGCEVKELFCFPSGYPPRGAEPNERNLLELAKKTVELGADVGIAHDIDADRMMIIDDRGRYVSGDKLLVILARSFGFEEIVTTLDASMILERMGFHVKRTRIGDTYVSAELINGGQFGGEPSGSWVFPELSLCPDGIYAAAKIASIAGVQKISELVDNIPAYPIVRGNIEGDGINYNMLEYVLSRKGNIENVSRNDGLKIIYDDGWVLIRPSGTEPETRLTMEAVNENRLSALYKEVMDSVQLSRGE